MKLFGNSVYRLFGKRIALNICLLFVCSIGISQEESDYYQISTLAIPEDIILEVGGLAFNEKGDLYASTRRGEVWRIENPDGSNPVFNRFARGLHEPLGLAYHDGAYYLAQRGELTKLSDANNDGKADKYETIFNWPLAANYHEYAYGPVVAPNGDMYINLNLSWVGRGASLAKWQGWTLKISPDGEMTPFATGLRSPAGLGFNKHGDLFYTENQGDWVGSGRMTHLISGDFAGHPEGLKWSGEDGSPVSLTMADITDTEFSTLFDYSNKMEGIKAPSVWFPHTLMGISTSDIVVVPKGFGPFEGQLLIGDQGHSKIMRVYQEKVNGEYQGACFGFVEGFSSGVLRMEWGPEETLYIGMTNRGWASTGKQPFGLQRLNWNGKTPFEMQKIEIEQDGFTIHFTQPVNKRSAANPDSYSITDFNYIYHHLYGSEVMLIEDRTIYKVSLAQDGMSARLYVEGMRPGFVYEIKPEGVKNEAGQQLLHGVAFYTINNIPGNGGQQAASTSATDLSKTVALASAKRPDKMPAGWNDNYDQEVVVTAIAGMKYDKTEITIKAGSKVKLVMDNPDDMMHNLLIVKPGTADAVGIEALKLGLKGQSLGYVPDSDDVLYHTNLLAPLSNDVIYFEAPTTVGDYEYVCTFPAHAKTMRGILKVVK
jgi:azurin